jgi:acetylglutamate kinase
MTNKTPATTDSERPLTALQQEIVDTLLSTGETVPQVAKRLNRDVSNTYRELKKTHVRRYLRERTLEHIGILAPLAAKAQGELLNSRSDQTRAAVAANILDRHLGKAVERRQVAFEGRIDVKIDLS